MGLMERLERAKMAKVASEKDVSLEELEYYDEYESFKESIHAELVKTAASEEGLGLQEVISRLVEEKGEEIPKPTQKRLIQQIVDHWSVSSRMIRYRRSWSTGLTVSMWNAAVNWT
mgnify:CR=1 FL=1